MLALLLLACSPAARHDLVHDGEDRNYYLYVPEAVTGPAPLVLCFHGGGPAGGSKGRNMGRFTGLYDKADAEGFVVAFPSSLDGNWNDGRDLTSGHVDDSVDDVGFTDALIEDIASSVDIDRARIYTSGVSNGGFFTQRLACERTETFAAAVSFIATMPAALACEPAAPIPVEFVLGTEDPLVLWEGGPVAGGERGESLSADDAAAFWAAHNGCTGGPEVEELPDLDPDDETRAVRESWSGCDAPVQRLTLEGAGHTWPGGGQYLPERTIGRASHDVDGADELWEFVRDHTR